MTANKDPNRTREAIAVDVLRCAAAWDPDARLVGNVTAAELAFLVSDHILTCPSCGSTAWVNIDCGTCVAINALSESDERARVKT